VLYSEVLAHGIKKYTTRSLLAEKANYSLVNYCLKNLIRSNILLSKKQMLSYESKKAHKGQHTVYSKLCVPDAISTISHAAYMLENNSKTNKSFPLEVTVLVRLVSDQNTVYVKKHTLKVQRYFV